MGGAGSGVELLIIVIAVPTAILALIYPLIVCWHGYGLIILAAALLALYALHLRKLYRNARDS